MDQEDGDDVESLHYDRLTTFRLISTTSNNLVLSEPSLWNIIGRQQARCAKAVQRILRRSQDTPLRICVDIGSRGVLLLPPVMHRITDLHL